MMPTKLSKSSSENASSVGAKTVNVLLLSILVMLNRYGECGDYKHKASVLIDIVPLLTLLV